MHEAQAFIKGLKKMHRLAVWTMQIGTFAMAGVLAFLLRFDFGLPHAYLRHLAFALPIWIVVKSVVFRFARLDRGWWRYVSTADLLRILLGNVVGSAVSCLAILAIAPRGFPRSIYVLDLMICFLATAGLRVAVRLLTEAAAQVKSETTEKNTLIYGAGDAGVTLLREIHRNPRLSYRVLGFLDDRDDKKGVHILGVNVLGAGNQVEALVKKHDIDIILIAIPSATGTEMTCILERCHAAGAECKTIPGLGEI